MRSRFSARALFGVSVALTALSLAAASSVWAAEERSHVYGSTFGAPGSGNGQLDKPLGVAVNEETGRVYVVDSANDRVEYFSSKGVYEGQFNGSGTLANEKGVAAPNGRFANLTAIAVDNSTSASDPSRGDVYVPAWEGEVTPRGRFAMKYDVVYKYSADGEYLGEIASTPECSSFDGELEKMETLKPCTFRSSADVAVGGEGEVYIVFGIGLDEASAPSQFIARFSDAVANSFEEQLSAATVTVGDQTGVGMAIDRRNNIFVDRARVEILGSPVIFENDGYEQFYNFETSRLGCAGENARWPAVEARTGDVYLAEHGGWLVCSNDGRQVLELGPTGHLTSSAGIAVDSKTGAVFVADEAKGDVVVFVPEPPGAPAITETHAGVVDASTASLAGRINPRSEAVDARTTYRFEYGRCVSAAECGSAAAVGMWQSIGDGVLPASFEASSVGVSVEGLAPSTAYRYRLVAENGQGRTVGAESVFVTEPVESPFLLPDGRGWELVTPSGGSAATPWPLSLGGIAGWASPDGSKFSFEADQPTEEGAKGFAGAYYSEQVLGSRGGSGGWSSVDITPPYQSEAGGWIGLGQGFRWFSEDLSEAIVEPDGAFSVPESGGVVESSPLPTGHTPYLRHNGTCAQAPATCYEPLLTAAKEGGDVEEHVDFGGPATAMLGNAQFVAATPDLSHVLIDSSVPLLPGDTWGLYEWSAGRIGFVGEGHLLSTTSEGSAGNRRGVISTDGSRIFFRGKSEGIEGLLMRDTVVGKTLRIAAKGVFQYATADGSRVFFTEGGELFECRVRAEAGGFGCGLSDLTPPAAGGENAGVLGSVLVGGNGSYVYFAANGVQAAGASPGDCATEQGGGEESCGLYVRHEGVTRLVATLSGEDYPDWELLYKMVSRVAPDGRWLAFMSDRSLTGYDNRDAVSTRPDEEVFLYDAAGDGGAGSLVCASCNPTGARPHGIEYKQVLRGENLFGGQNVWNADTWLAASTPTWVTERGAGIRQPRYLSDEGRLFFNAGDALVPQDTNGNEDVYEFEPVGVPAGGAHPCGVSLSTFSVAAGGCLSLISSGVASGQAAFLEASRSSGDVFFLSSGASVPGDGELGLNVYDAHECTAGSPCAPAPAALPPECGTAESCRVALSPQPVVFGASGSATFDGTGNLSAAAPVVSRGGSGARARGISRAQRLARALKACRKKRGRQRRSCEREARKRLGGKRARHARHLTRGGRGVSPRVGRGR
jgi:DNA-binding beta-propeller fold protein YncE